MSVKEELTIAVLMRFVTTAKDPITAHVNQDMKGTEIIAQVIFFVLLVCSHGIKSFLCLFVCLKALLFLFFHDTMYFI